MKQPFLSVRYLPFSAFALSLAMHFILFSTFIFTVPLSRVSFMPSFIFLGSILKEQDVGDVFQPEEKSDESLSISRDLSSDVANDFFPSAESSGRRFIQGTARHPVSAESVGTREKVVTKSLFDIPTDVPKEQAGSLADTTEADQEIAPYNHLGLFPR